MELFHGPTLAFKDIALQMLPQLMTRAVQIEKIDRDIIILTATSGDTGTASMRGFANQKGTSQSRHYPLSSAQCGKFRVVSLFRNVRHKEPLFPSLWRSASR